MPMFDFQCRICQSVDLDVLLHDSSTPVPCPKDRSHGPMEKLPSAPAFRIKGFASVNGYSGGQTKEHKVPGEPNMKVVVKS